MRGGCVVVAVDGSCFGFSVGFLGVRSVIHPLFGKKASKLKHQRAINPWEDHGFDASLCLHSCTRALVCEWRHPAVSVWALTEPVFLG